MNYLEPKELGADLASQVGANGIGGIQRFSSKQFGATFSRIVYTDHVSVVVEEHPDTGEPMARVSAPRTKNTVLYGRLCSFPNTTASYWQSLSEEEPFDNPSDHGRDPYISFRYDGYYLVFVNSNNAPSVGQKVVVQLLHCEL